MPRRRTLAVAAVMTWLVVMSAGAATLSGRVELVGKDGKPMTGQAEARHAVVYFEPAAAAKLQPVSLEMVTRGKEFVPLVLAVPRGSTVKFPNLDPILHNVFSVSTPNNFDLGLYAKGPGKAWTFNAAGIVRVFCNVHHAMVGYIVVLNTPYFATAGADGAFSLLNLPSGPGRLTVWHPQTEPLTLELDPAKAGRTEARLTVTKERVPPHANKAGKAYSRTRRDRYDG